MTITNSQDKFYKQNDIQAYQSHTADTRCKEKLKQSEIKETCSTRKQG